MHRLLLIAIIAGTPNVAYAQLEHNTSSDLPSRTFENSQSCPSGWRPGSCGAVKGNRRCKAGRLKGGWPAVKSTRECVHLCQSCTSCRFVSYSSLDRDCSWFASCDLRLREYELSCAVKPSELVHGFARLGAAPPPMLSPTVQQNDS